MTHPPLSVLLFEDDEGQALLTREALWTLGHEYVLGDYYFLADDGDEPSPSHLVSLAWARSRDPLNHADELFAMLRLDPGATKNDEGRVVCLTPELKPALGAPHSEHG